METDPERAPTQRVVVPAAHGKAVRVDAGQKLRLETPHGQQAADFFAYPAEDLGEWLSPNHTFATTKNVHPRQGDVLLSTQRRPILKFVEDGAGGVHDMMLAACDQKRYEQFGHQSPHRSCADNLKEAMRDLGYEIAVIPQPINFFTNTAVLADGTFVSPPNPVPPGSFLILEALVDLICVVSSSPFALQLPGWTINAAGGPTELLVEVGA